MFTGIVEEVGVVRSLEQVDDHVRLSVQATVAREDLRLGDSVSVEGACLTITALDPQGFEVGLAPETLRRTALSTVRPGTRVNLERALRVGDRLGGHIVQGHVDGTAQIVSIQPDGDSLFISFEIPDDIAPYIVQKGFVALDGASLTVADRSGRTFSVALIAYTQSHVSLVDKGVGERVNVEVDILAKYVESILGSRGDDWKRTQRNDATALMSSDR
jgi:riboflavin synthase